MSFTQGHGNTSQQPVMGRRNRNNLIPEGWQGCPSMGTGFVDDRFFVFKTPLKPELNNRVSSTERFSVENIFERVHQMNHSRIGMWIDLTNTSRYYNPAQIQCRGVEYAKLSCEGHGKPPSKRSITAFCNMVQHFFNRNRRDYIGVHCTHGFNRTGYLICSYLIRCRRYTAAEAVFEFAKFRQPGIYRQSYVDDLYTMSFPNETPVQVSDPEWLTRRMTVRNDAPSSSSSQAVQASTSFGASNDTSSSEVESQESHNEHQQLHSSALLPQFPIPSSYDDVPMPIPSTSQQAAFMSMPMLMTQQHQPTPLS